MLTMLVYVLAVALVAALLYAFACAVFGRSEEMAPLPEHTTATVLPVAGIRASDVTALRFQQVVRGYKTSEVDWTLERLAAEIESLREQLAQARAAASEPAPSRTGLGEPAPPEGVAAWPGNGDHR
ncbi:MAG: DivIVA domain-containing protein [Mycobacteriaceae bacterium]|nr:DivIVA domain-containing protein [Mycobacteriaceae bacterium]